MNRKSGFTLAEVLVTLMIIGVIAAMTIPSLMQNTAQQEFKAAYKKAISMLNQAVTLNYALDGEDASNFEKKTLFHLLTKRLNVMSSKNEDYVYTADGMYFQVLESAPSGQGIQGSMPAVGGCTTDGEKATTPCSAVKIDVNGPKGPNKFTTGTQAVYDQFYAIVYPQKALPAGQIMSDVLYNK